MVRKEQLYAEQLYAALQKEFNYAQSTFGRLLGFLTNKNAPNRSNAVIEKRDWHCTVLKGERSCTIHCFNIDYTDVAYKGPQFSAYFIENGRDEAAGRTLELKEMVAAVWAWVEGDTVKQLYNQFEFVDLSKRRLDKIRISINNAYPKMVNLPQNEVTNSFRDSYSLQFKRDNRSCSVHLHGHENMPTYEFFWDDTKIFTTSGPGETRLGTLVKKWVHDKSMPSSLRSQFPEINFGKLAEYYEKGMGIEGEFMLSWDSVVDFYNDRRFPQKVDILRLIQQMRNRGFDKLLRAGQSMHTLILSRSRRHGLDKHQDSLAFSFKGTAIGFSYSVPTGDMGPAAMEAKTRKGEIVMFDKIDYNETIENLLRRLAEQPIE